ncbi:hypothetical protein HETIRDRAFT_429907 [Heterobasidion irregulare TC 32-1]|uniref:Uncharacterized protein n=1 Tax=Heterobasidion irregulare (strain TC 32-1) TaxID=747525 RepID=W4JSM5_HETIT|nr:uncharacterized protein HETIRDRAFT_429907 [Heterobasidion irregulare TC 32-1]ETW76459.1 hypothetical protein HETIRDRAFT_429907 [Heterobasidion irregulare TC 32-1]
MIFLLLQMASIINLTINYSDSTFVNESTQMTPTPKSSVTEEQFSLSDKEQAAYEAGMDDEATTRLQEEEDRYRDEIMEELKYQERLRQYTEEEAAHPTPSPPHSPSPPPLICEGNKGIIFLDRELYLSTPVTYLMGLIEGSPSTEFVLGPTWPEIQRALEILEEERAFVQHAQSALQMREGTLIARINAGSEGGIREAFGRYRTALDKYQRCRLAPNTVGPCPTNDKPPKDIRQHLGQFAHTSRTHHGHTGVLQ